MDHTLFSQCKAHVIKAAINLGMNKYEANSNVYPIEDFDELLSFIYFLRDAYSAPENILNVTDALRPDMYLMPWEQYNEWEVL